MRLRHLLVERFRGIRRLDWTWDGATICLVGPGDSTKTTILDAVEWALSPRWSLPVADTDFYRVTSEEPIVIEATVGELPPALLSDQKFGLEQRGWGFPLRLPRRCLDPSTITAQQSCSPHRLARPAPR